MAGLSLCFVVLAACYIGITESFFQRPAFTPYGDGKSLYKSLMMNKRFIENVICEHIDAIDCSDYEEDPSERAVCMNTATGYVCCMCREKVNVMQLAGSLKQKNGAKFFWTWSKPQRDFFLSKVASGEFASAYDPETMKIDA